MKNIHLIPTPEVSRIVLREKDKKIVLHTPITQWHGINQYIYITSNDKPLEPEWGYVPFEGGTVKRIGRYFADDWKKIILTTDPKLIEDGVQAIDENFLKWYVKNPSCEYVEVEQPFNPGSIVYGINTNPYEIIIPKEEPTMVDKLKEYFNNTTEEQIQKDWEEACRQTEGINSPTVDEFLEVQKQFSNQMSLEYFKVKPKDELKKEFVNNTSKWNMEDKEKFEKIIDELYSCYEAEISLQNVRYIHPMFYNGTFCENNCYQPPEPNKLMTKEEFIEKMNSEGEEYRWNTASQVLYNYISKQFND